MIIYLLNVRELIQESHESRLEALLSKLDEDRRRKALSARTPQAKAAQLGAGLLLQKAARDWLNSKTHYGAVRGKSPESVLCTVSGLFSELPEPLAMTYRRGEKGKPYFREIPLFFSLSHSGDYVLCAASCREVGADIQKMQPTDIGKLAKRFFAEPEYLGLERCKSAEERRRRFFELWSRKEAWGKLTGDGVTAALGEDTESIPEEQGAEWLEITPPEGYTAAVCEFRRDFPWKDKLRPAAQDKCIEKQRSRE